MRGREREGRVQGPLPDLGRFDTGPGSLARRSRGRSRRVSSRRAGPGYGGGTLLGQRGLAEGEKARARAELLDGEATASHRTRLNGACQTTHEALARAIRQR